ncbi:MAG: hypothetical protein COB53_01190 [Elusimicrobia bacterium]|nr:MAG: hypothetical protein COB53_01190 [Elusimicrobiota bacterium]
MTGTLILFLLLSPTTAIAARYVSVISSEPASPVQPLIPEKPVFGAPLRLEFLVDSNGSPRAHLGYSIRWNLQDLPSVPARIFALARDPFGTLEQASKETLQEARIGIYTLHFKASDVLPIDTLLRPLALASAWTRPRSKIRGSGPARAPQPRKPLTQPRRRRLRLTPVYDELERGFWRELRRGAISTIFDLAIPVNGSVPYSQKEIVIEDLIKTREIWEEEW